MTRSSVAAAAAVAIALAGAPDPAAYPHPRGYVAVRAAVPPVVDGRLDDPAWRMAPWTDDFVDIEGDLQPKPALRTRVKMLWDDGRLYIGADLAEPNLWATQREHDSVVFRENDFEFFVDPDGDNHGYGEFEMNALNTGWDLFLPRPYKDEGHAVNGWEIAGLKTAVHLDGTLNDPADVDRGWSIEIAVPWAALGELTHRPSPPRDGDQWRINFSRVEWALRPQGKGYRKIEGTSEHNWVWSPQHVIDMHRPETWGYVQFEHAARPFVADASWPARRWLHAVYYAEREYRRQHGQWTESLEELGVAMAPDQELKNASLEATANLFEASVLIGEQRWHIRQDSLVWTTGEGKGSQ